MNLDTIAFYYAAKAIANLLIAQRTKTLHVQYDNQELDWKLTDMEYWLIFAARDNIEAMIAVRTKIIHLIIIIIISQLLSS